MRRFTESEARIVADALKESGATSGCPRCKNFTWSLMHGFFVQVLQNDPTKIDMNETAQTIPSVVLVCKKCGFISQHSTKILGLESLRLPDDKAAKNG